MSVILTVCWKRNIREKAGEQGDTWKRKKKKAQAKENELEQRCFENNG